MENTIPAFKILKSTSKRLKNDKVSKIFFRKSLFFTNIFTETPITRSFLNIFSIRFFYCILEVLVHLYWCAKVFYDPSFRRVVKKKNRFRPKTGFFTQVLSRPAFNNHFTHLLYLLKPLAFVLVIPTVSLKILYHVYSLCYGLKCNFLHFLGKFKLRVEILAKNSPNLIEIILFLQYYVKLLE